MAWHDMQEVTLVNKKQYLVANGMAWCPVEFLQKQEFLFLTIKCHSLEKNYYQANNNYKKNLKNFIKI